MGRPKLSLPLGKSTVIEQLVHALRSGGCQTVVVVIGPHVPEIAPLATAAGAHVCQLLQKTADMRATVEAGLHWVEQKYHPAPRDPWLLAPADHPTVEADIVRQLLEALHRRSHTIIIPTFEGKRGHPTLLAWSHVDGIRSHTPGEGLNSYFRTCQSDTLELPASSESILWDLDTPADYERLRSNLES
jgi:molybdenum cofactor cytidylyltransferase